MQLLAPLSGRPWSFPRAPPEAFRTRTATRPFAVPCDPAMAQTFSSCSQPTARPAGPGPACPGSDDSQQWSPSPGHQHCAAQHSECSRLLAAAEARRWSSSNCFSVGGGSDSAGPRRNGHSWFHFPPWLGNRGHFDLSRPPEQWPLMVPFPTVAGEPWTCGTSRVSGPSDCALCHRR